MEPKLPSPEIRQEQYPAPTTGTEWQDMSERRVESRPELQSDNGQEQAQVAMPTILPPPVIPLPPQLPASPQSAVTVTDDTPMSAGDDDLIEREWVDKAKKIIVSTKDDPYRREVEIAKLQIDYLRKRYGKELGEAA